MIPHSDKDCWCIATKWKIKRKDLRIFEEGREAKCLDCGAPSYSIRMTLKTFYFIRKWMVSHTPCSPKDFFAEQGCKLFSYLGYILNSASVHSKLPTRVHPQNHEKDRRISFGAGVRIRKGELPVFPLQPDHE